MLIPLNEITTNCVAATVKVLLLCLAGVCLARNGVLTETKIRGISKVSQDIFIPCVIFSNFVTVNSAQIFMYFPVIIIAAGMIFLGIQIGKLLNKYVVKDEKYSVMFQILCGFAHTLNIQLSMAETLGPLLDKFDVASNMTYEMSGTSRGVVFATLITSVNNILRWSLMTKLIKENEKDSGSEKANLEMKSLSSKGKELPSNEVPLIQSTEPSEPKGLKAWIKSIDEIMNPPLAITLISLVIALIPPLQQILIDESSLVCQLVTKSAKFIGQTSSAILLVLLGANIGNPSLEGEKPSNLAIVSVTATKMFVMPIVGYILIMILQGLSIMTDATMMTMVLITFAAPTANNILVQYASLGKEMGTISRMVLATYVCSIITLPLTLMVFFSTYSVE